jgi:hypothetical protein
MSHFFLRFEIPDIVETNIVESAGQPHVGIPVEKRTVENKVECGLGSKRRSATNTKKRKTTAAQLCRIQINALKPRS